MWCRKCGQDVPGVPALEDGQFCCPRCSETLSQVTPLRPSQELEDGSGVEAGAEVEPSAGGNTPKRVLQRDLSPPGYDGWEISEDLRHVERLLESGGHQRKNASERGKTLRAESVHAGPPAPHFSAAGRPQAAERATASQKQCASAAARLVPNSGTPTLAQRPSRQPATGGALSGLAWAALSLGTAAIACGGMLLGWSMATGRQELWGLGTPIALAGQVALLIGLVLQLDRVWRDNRSAADKLDQVDEDLHELKTTTTLLGTSHGPSAASFYAHLADGANPQLLLHDLKGQLDLLALKMAQTEK
jgi:hypothetical protein